MTIVKSGYARRELELYQTEPYPTRALMNHVPMRGVYVWEPAAGNHMMADVLKEQAHSVFTSDVRTYDREHDDVIDFERFKPPRTPMSFGAIVTNPPYGPGGHQAARWCRKALSLCDSVVAMLMRVNFDSGSSRADLFRDNTRFAMKIVLLDRISWTLDGRTGTEDHSWFVWGIPGSSPGIIQYERRPGK